MSTFLAKNAEVLVTMDSQRREVKNAGLYAENGFIKQIGPNAELPATADTVIDLSGQIVLPGFVNTHHHLNQTLTRNLPAAQNNNLFPWLQAQYRIWARTTQKASRASTLVGLGGASTFRLHDSLFVCSIGNIPLASVLWSGGISFGGVISFIYADLIVIPLILIYRKYYGARATFFIVTVMFISMVLAGIIVDVLFSVLHLVPTGPRPNNAVSEAHFSWNYTTFLDLAAIAWGGWLLYLSHRASQQHDAAIEQDPGHEHHHR
jgi:hypothetical protein